MLLSIPPKYAIIPWTPPSPYRRREIIQGEGDGLFDDRGNRMSPSHAAERFWSDRYLLHSAIFPPGRDGLFNLVENMQHRMVAPRLGRRDQTGERDRPTVDS
jgi:hypothetical protein